LKSAPGGFQQQKPTIRKIVFSNEGVISLFRASEEEKAQSGAVEIGDAAVT